MARRGDAEGAAESYRGALCVDLTLVEAHYNLGPLLRKRGDAAGAEGSTTSRGAAPLDRSKLERCTKGTQV